MQANPESPWESTARTKRCSKASLAQFTRLVFVAIAWLGCAARAASAAWEVRPFGGPTLISNSVAMTWDDRARLWVLETHGAGDSVQSRLLVLSDDVGDGSRISVKVFAASLPRSTGFEWSPRGVILGSPPNLLLVQDTNHDDVADSVAPLWNGLGSPAERSSLSSFAWGPDNRLYCLFQTPNTARAGRAGTPTNEWTRLNPGVLRYHPGSRSLEAFAEGPERPAGLDFDEDGNLFVASASRESLFHVLQGATCLPRDHFPRAFDGYAAILPSVSDRGMGRLGSGGLLALGTSEASALFGGQFLLGRTNPLSFQPIQMRSRGAGFRASGLPEDRAVPSFGGRTDQALLGPDGSVWLRSAHRIARVVPTAGSAPSPSGTVGVSGWSTGDLISGLQHSNRWVRRMAQRALVERQDPASIQGVMDGQKGGGGGNSKSSRIAALWTLSGLTNADRSWLARAAQDRDPVIRSWAVRFLVQLSPSSPELIQALARHAVDADPRVRLQVAVAVRRLEVGDRVQDGTLKTAVSVPDALSILDPLMAASAAEDDPLIGAMMWGATEPLLVTDTAAVLEWLRRAGERSMPLSGDLLSRSIRRLFGTHDPAAVEVSLSLLSKLAEESPALCTLGLEGMMLGQKGSKLWSGHKGVKRLLAQLSSSANPELSRSAEQVDALCGNPRAQAAILRRINDPAVSEGDRLKAVLFSRLLPSDGARTALLDVLSGTNGSLASLSLPALSALEEIGRAEEAAELVRRWKYVPEELKPSVLESLAARADWAAAVVGGLESGRIAAAQLSESILSQLRSHPNPLLQARLKAALQRGAH